MHATVQVYERDPEFDNERYSAEVFGSFFSDAEHGSVRWRFTPSAAPVAREFMFHPKQELTELDNGSLGRQLCACSGRFKGKNFWPFLVTRSALDRP